MSSKKNEIIEIPVEIQKKQSAEMGRPKIPINFEELDKLCGIQCTLIEIADYFNCSEDTIERRINEVHNMTFADYYKTKSTTGKRSLRRLQYEAAQKGNIGMMVWLGKQWLGQQEKTDISHSGEINVNMTFSQWIKAINDNQEKKKIRNNQE